MTIGVVMSTTEDRMFVLTIMTAIKKGCLLLCGCCPVDCLRLVVVVAVVVAAVCDWLLLFGCCLLFH